MALFLDTFRKEGEHTFMKMEDFGEYVGDVRIDQAAKVAEEILFLNARDYDIAKPDEIVVPFDLIDDLSRSMHEYLMSARDPDPGLVLVMSSLRLCIVRREQRRKT